MSGALDCNDSKSVWFARSEAVFRGRFVRNFEKGQHAGSSIHIDWPTREKMSVLVHLHDSSVTELACLSDGQMRMGPLKESFDVLEYPHAP